MKPLLSSSSMNDGSAMSGSLNDIAPGYVFARNSCRFGILMSKGLGTFRNIDTWKACRSLAAFASSMPLGNQFGQQFEPLGIQFGHAHAEAREVPARPRETDD